MVGNHDLVELSIILSNLFVEIHVAMCIQNCFSNKYKFQTLTIECFVVLKKNILSIQSSHVIKYGNNRQNIKP